MRKEIRFLILLGVMLLALGGMIMTQQKKGKREEVPYLSFIEMAKNGEVKHVVYSDEAMWQAALFDGREILTPNPRTENGKEMLLSLGIEVTERMQPEVETVLFALLFGMMMFGRRGNMSMERFDIVNGDRKVPEVTFRDVIVGKETLEGMRDVAHYLKDGAAYEKMGARPPRGVMLYGPPGTGKTLLARALAGETGKPFFAVSGSDFVEVYVGVGAGRIRSLFKKARKAGGGVIFIDEIDALGKKRDQGNEEREQTLNALLTEMSGFSGKDGVIVLAATNRLDTLDGALLREGRFDRHIEVGLPGREERLQILQVHSRKKPMDPQVSMENWAERTVLFSGAQLESLMNEAAIRAVRGGDALISERHMEQAFLAQTAGEEKKMTANRKEKHMIAVHEAGHALLTHLLLPQSRLTRLTILPSNKGAAGYSLAIHEDRVLYTRQELMHHMSVTLGGRAAEEVMFGKEQVTNGAGSDLKKAEALACEMAEWRMSDEEDGERAKRGLMEEAYAIAKQKIGENRQRLEGLSRALMERETLSGEEILHFVA